MTVDFDAVFGNKAAPSNNGPQPAAGKAPALSDCPDRARLQTKTFFGFAGSSKRNI